MEDTTTVTLTVDVQPGAAPSVTNTATTTARQPPASATDTASVTVPPSPPAGPTPTKRQPGSLPFTGFDLLLFGLSTLALTGLGTLTASSSVRRRQPGP